MSTTEKKSGLRVKCIITGKPSYLGSEILQKKILEFGSKEEVLKHYISRGVAKLLREGASQEDIRKSLGLIDISYIPIDAKVIDKALGTKKRKKKTSNVVDPNLKPDENGVNWWSRPDFKVAQGWDQIPADIAVITKDSCVRPDIYLDGICEPCKHFAICQLPIKRIKGRVPKAEKIEIPVAL